MRLSQHITALLITGFASALFTPMARAEIWEKKNCEDFDREYTCAQAPESKKTTEAELGEELSLNGSFELFFRADREPTAATQELNRSRLTHKLWTRLTQYQERYACAPKYTISRHAISFDDYAVDRALSDRNMVLNYTNREAARIRYDRLNRRELTQKRANLLVQLQSAFDEDRGNLTYCADRPESTVNYPAAIIQEPCVIAITQNLPDNDYRVEKYLPQISSSPSYQEGVACLKGRIADLAKVTIFSSSNALNNTGSEFCKKDFQNLSKARAERTRDVLLPLLLGGQEKTLPTELDFLGRNRDGTSGPCPYRKNARGDEEIIPAFLSDPGLRKELDQAKFLMIRFEFGANRNELNNMPHQVSHMLPCASIHLSCQ